MTDSPELTTAESSAVNALVEVIGDDPQEVRRILSAVSFRDRALIAAWTEELSRLVRDVQDNYETSERRAARDRREAEASEAASRKALRTRISLMFEESGADAPAVSAADFVYLRQSRHWTVGELKRLTDGGVLRPVSDYPGRYVILKAPGGDNV